MLALVLEAAFVDRTEDKRIGLMSHPLLPLRQLSATARLSCAAALPISGGINWPNPLRHALQGRLYCCIKWPLVERGYPCTQRFPRIVSALLLGLEKEWVVVEWGTTSRIGEAHFEYQPEVEKRSKCTVPLAAFRNPANSCVSAVLYSASGPPCTSAPFFLFCLCYSKVLGELHDDGLILHLPPHAEP
jgi:hypothetical protein